MNGNLSEKEADNLPTTENDNPEINSNNNSVPEKTEDPSLTLINSEDLKVVLEIMKKQKLTSVMASLAGTVAVPQGLMGKTIFYLSFEGPTSSKITLMKAHVYSSCQNSPSCLRDLKLKQGDRLDIQTANLKRIEDRWEIFLDKNTQINLLEKQKLKKASVSKSITKKDTSNLLKKQEGRIIAIKGEIVDKKGDYFFVLDSKTQKIISIFIPKLLQNSFVQNLDQTSLGYFPFYLQTQPNKSWVGGFIDAKGVIEKADTEYRVLAIELDKMLLNDLIRASSKKKGNNEDKEKTRAGTALENTNAKTKFNESKEKTNQNVRTANVIENQTATNTNTIETGNKEKPTKEEGRDKIKRIFAQNLSWRNIWSILAEKIKLNIGELF